MGTALPAGLRSAIAMLAQSERSAVLAERASNISSAYRRGETSAGLKDAADAAAYVASRMPATYAAVSAALAELASLRPGYRPASLLDAGCGPGTAALAALERYPELQDLTLADRNAQLLGTARALFATADPGARRRITFQNADLLTDVPSAASADMVMMAYVLVEFTEAESATLALSYFSAAKEVLLLVEPGSQAGFRRIRAARASLIESGATILAPCTHQHACPIQGSDWCHFSVRLARSREHLRAKSASVPFEDEKFSYLIAVHAGSGANGARVIGLPRLGKTGVELPICADGQVETVVIASRSADFRRAKKLSWGERTDPVS